MGTWYRIQLMIYQHQRPGSRWLIVTAIELLVTKVDHTAQLALNSVCAL